jgi:hypothetical protein
MVPVLWKTRAIAAHINASQMKYAHAKTFNAPDLSLDICDG